MKMVKLDNAEFLIRFQILLGTCLLILSLVFSSIKTRSHFKDCIGEGADILLLVDVSHPTWKDSMRMYSSALMKRFRVGKTNQMSRFMKVEYMGSPMKAVNMDFFENTVDSVDVNNSSKEMTGSDAKRDVDDDNSVVKMSQNMDSKLSQTTRGTKETTTPQKDVTVKPLQQQEPKQHSRVKFLIILTASEEVLTSDTKETVAKMVSLNITTVVAAFDYIHKVPIDDLSSIASDSLYIFLAHKVHAQVLVNKIVNVVCRETRAHDLHNSRHVTYDCSDSNPCSTKVFQNNLLTFPYWIPSKYVLCLSVNRCVIRDCIHGSLWNESTRICH